MKMMSRRWAASLAASSLVLSGLAFATTPAGAQEEPPVTECVADRTINVLAYNDFHGRILGAAEFFSIAEEQRALHGEDNVVLLSVGDDIGGSIFESMVDQDNPTLDILNAIEVDAQAVGNHEFDKTWADLSGRVNDRTNFPHLGANVYDAGTSNVAAPLQAYEIITVDGFDIAVIGAVTEDLPSLVDPSGISALTVGDPVEAINREAAAIEAAGSADFIIATIHEGAANGNSSAESNAASPGAFSAIYNNISADVDLVFNGHTHQLYNWQTANGTPLLQAGQYGENMNSVELEISAEGEVCVLHAGHIATPEAPLSDNARISEIQRIIAEAEDTAAELGAVVIGEATEAISTPTGNADKRDVESPITNAVAQMFHEVLGNGDPEFIGVQNPGGTRASFDAGDITYREAALTLPFANSLFSTQITGAQVKEMLEQQWQRNAAGEVPSRAFLRLGLSDNVSYTYDESRDEGDRITSVSINGAPIDPEKLYGVGSGSFLISGGDNFHVLGDGVNTVDTGRVDLEAWVDWVAASSPLTPDYTKRGVSTQVSVAEEHITVNLGEILGDGLADETLDMNLTASETNPVSPALANTTVTASVGGVDVATGVVTDGVGTIEIPRTALAADVVQLTVGASGTVVNLPVEAAWFMYIGADPSEFEIGQPVTITAGTFVAGAEVTLTVIDDQQAEVWTTVLGHADDSGQVEGVVTFPTSLPHGLYTVVLTDGQGNTVSATLTLGDVSEVDDDDDDTSGGSSPRPGLPGTGV